MPARVKLWLRLALGLGGLVLAAFAYQRLDLPRRTLALVTWSQVAGALGVAVYGALYVLGTVLLLPGSLLTLGAGFAWGPLLGVAIVSPASVLAASVAFALGRTFLRARIENRLGRDPRKVAIDRAIGNNGLVLVLLLRLSPLFPFNFLNYALSLSRVSFRDFVVGSAVGMFPGTLLFVYLGSLVTKGSELLSAGASHSSPASLYLYWGGLVATVVAVIWVSHVARKALRGAFSEQAIPPSTPH